MPTLISCRPLASRVITPLSGYAFERGEIIAILGGAFVVILLRAHGHADEVLLARLDVEGEPLNEYANTLIKQRRSASPPAAVRGDVIHCMRVEDDDGEEAFV